MTGGVPDVSRTAIAARGGRLWTEDIVMSTLEFQGEWAELKAEWAALSVAERHPKG